MPEERVSKTSNSKVILLVGSNPSRAGKGVPFVGTRSFRTLENWVERVGKGKFYAINAVDEITENNRPLTVRQMRKNIVALRSKVYAVKPDLIVALGGSASKALLIANVSDHLKVPHPSGLNRSLNDSRCVDGIVHTIRYLIE